MKYYIYSALLSGSLLVSGCTYNSTDDGVYSPIVTVATLFFIADANVSMATVSPDANYLESLGRYQFEDVTDFYEMNSSRGVYGDLQGLETVVARVVCDANKTNNLAINALVPELWAPDSNSSEYPYVNMNMFTTLLAYNSREELSSRYPNSYAMNHDFNYDVLTAAYSSYSTSIGETGGDEARDNRFNELCQAEEELIANENVVKSYPVYVTALYKIKDANATMQERVASYESRGLYRFNKVDATYSVEVEGGRYITDENNESDYDEALANTCPDLGDDGLDFVLSAPKVDDDVMPYIFINPFTTLLAQGKTIEELNTTYPLAYATENSFNFNTAYKNRTFDNSEDNNFTLELCNAMKAIQK